MKFRIPQSAQKALDTLNDNGYEGYLVGGCVRNWLMGATPHDFDITTNALPEQIKSCFDGYRTIETGIKHGTITVIIYGESLEITTYRADGEYLDNRRPESVEFVSSLSEDLSRRDFTMNAIAYANGELVDLFSGVEDIKNGSIRCVGNPEKRFDEDALRIMRALRFSATLGFKIESETSNAINKKCGLLANISAERNFIELKKLICGDFAEQVLDEYAKVICEIIPQLSIENVQGYAKKVGNIQPNLPLRLAGLLLPLKAEADIALYLLKVDKVTKTLVLNAIKACDCALCDETSALLAVSELGFDAVIIAAELKGETGLAQFIKKAKEKEVCVHIRQLKISGDDLSSLGMSGKQIGECLSMLLRAVILGEVKNEYSELLKKAQELNNKSHTD